MIQKRSRFFIPITVYLTALAMILYYNLTHELVNDGVWEYLAYMSNIEVGWVFRSTLVNSCVIPVWIPAILQKLTGWDSMILFRVFPAPLYALMPMFVYLIAKRYLGVGYSLIATLVVLVNSHFLFFPDIGRVGIGLGFFAGLVWALLNKRMIWSIVFAVLVVFAHYGLSIIALGLLGFVSMSYLIIKRQWAKHYLIILCIMIPLVGVWHFGIAQYSGFAMLNTGLQTDVPQSGYLPSEFLLIDIDELVSIESRAPEVQKAFGTTWVTEPTPVKIAIIANWLLILLMTVGLYAVHRNKQIDFQLKTMMLAMYGLIGLTAIIPWLSIFHGTTRSLFIGSTVLSLCIPLGAKLIADKIRISPLLIIVPILVLYALSTSGVIYLPFGLEKTFPILVTLK